MKTLRFEHRSLVEHLKYKSIVALVMGYDEGGWWRLGHRQLHERLWMTSGVVGAKVVRRHAAMLVGVAPNLLKAQRCMCLEVESDLEVEAACNVRGGWWGWCVMSMEWGKVGEHGRRREAGLMRNAFSFGSLSLFQIWFEIYFFLFSPLIDFAIGNF